MFERQIADKVHANLVVRKHQPPAPIAVAGQPTVGAPIETLAPSQTRLGVASAQAISDLGISLPAVLVGNDVIITGKKHKQQILQEYEDEFGSACPKSIITRKKVKHSHEPDTARPTRMLPSITKYY